MSAAIAAVVGGALQSAGQFQELIATSVELFHEQSREATQHHLEMRQQTIEHHERHAEHVYNLHDQTIFQQDALASKEMMRDVWQQKNEVCQTRMICATLMFGCCFSTVSDGFPQIAAPAGDSSGSGGSGSGGAAHGGGLLVLSIFLTLSVCLLLASISVTLVMYRRLSRYDVDRPLRRYLTCGHVHREFSAFFTCQCHRWEEWGLRLMYMGMICTAVTLLSLQAIKYQFVFGGTSTLWSVEPVLISVFGAGVIGTFVASYVFPDDTLPTARQPA
jgi:hypothetical protein